MIEVSDACHDVITSSPGYSLQCRITVTRAGTVLSDSIPVLHGTEEYNSNARVPTMVTLQIPREVDGVDIGPEAVDDPLAPYGQRIHVQLGVGMGVDGVEWINRGEFLIVDTTPTGDTLTVVAADLLYLIDEARLLIPYTPTGTFTQTVRALVEPAMNISVDAAVTALDRTVPANVAEDEDRIQCLYNVLAAWPARAQTAPDGRLLILPADTWPDGGFAQRYNVDGAPAANVLRVDTAMTRQGAANVVLARGQDPAGGFPYYGVAWDRSGGPTAANSPFSPLPVPEFYASSLLDTATRAQLAAETRLRTRQQAVARRWDMDLVPDPRWQGGDIVTYRDHPSSTAPAYEKTARIETLTVPYTATSGMMRANLREVVV